MSARVLSIVLVVLAAAPVGAQSTLNQLRLAEGETDINKLAAPVFDASATAPLAIGTFTSGYDRKQLFVRRGGGNMFTRGPEYKLNPSVDVASIFAASLASQATAMGLRIGRQEETGWRLSGTIKDVFLESRQIPYGATLFYGYLDTQVQLRGPNGEQETAAVRLHNYCGGYNAGLGRRDEAESCAAQLLIEGAQELLARLNRTFFRAAPHAAMTARLTAIETDPADPQRTAIRAIGLSGLETAALSLLKRLPTETSESGRSALIDAIAMLGSVSAVSTLAARYALEDEDPRWYTLKAMDYIGSNDAMKLVSTAGLTDEDVGPKRLAQRIMKK